MTKFLLGFFSFGWLRGFDFLPPLFLRLFLAPLLWVSGSNKLGLFSSSDSILYKPLTWVNLDNPVYEATVTGLSKLDFIPEALAPLLVTSIGILEVTGAFLLLIGFAVRWVSLPLLALVILTAIMSLNGENIVDTLKAIVNSHGYTDMSESNFGKILIYFMMLLTLFFMGAGRFFSVDWLLYRSLNKRIRASTTIKPREVVRRKNTDPFDIDNTTD